MNIDIPEGFVPYWVALDSNEEEIYKEKHLHDLVKIVPKAYCYTLRYFKEK